jgi:tetratricopeptide (TPR) repeat protein
LISTEAVFKRTRKRQQIMAKKVSRRTVLTPLGIIGAFLSLTEVVAGIAASKTTGNVQAALTAFVCLFPVIVAVAFFAILWKKPHVFYPPAEFGSQQDVRAYVQAMQSKPESQAIAIGLSKAEPEPLQTLPTKSETGKEVTVEETKDSIVKSEDDAGKVKTVDDLQMEMLMAFVEKRFDDAEKSFTEVLSLEQDSDKQKEHEVWHAYLQFAYAHEQNGFNELLRLSKLSDTQSLASFYLGLCYENLKEFDKAVESLAKSVETATPDTKPSRLVNLAVAQLNSGKPSSAISTLVNALEQTSNEKRIILYQGLAQIFHKTGDNELRALALELAVDEKPQDTDIRFSAAWSYSANGIRDMGFLHYSAELSVNPDDPAALNNLGVACQDFGLPISAIRNYRRALDNSNSLAGSNLAYRYLDAGFLSEAKKVLEEAKNMKEPHRNVGTATAALSERDEKEDVTTNQILERARKEQVFFKEYANAYFYKRVDEFAGEWRISGGSEIFTVTKNIGVMKAEWTLGEEKKELSGIINNRAGKITLKVLPEGGTLFAALAKTYTGWAFTADNGQRMEWLWFDNNLPVFTTANRVKPSPV